MAAPAPMLQGYRVLDFTHMVAGSTCTRILAEMGAQVIKVEPAPDGDRVRALGLRRDGCSTYYFQHNHSKKSLAMDLKRPRARELLYLMLPKIDVVAENYAPGAIARLGFGYEKLSALKPDLIMCSVSMAGQTGPLSYKAGYDYMGQAYAGVTDLIGEPDRAPATLPIAIGDISTGVAAAMAVGFALLHRERTGEGQYIDASLIDTYFHMHELSVPLVAIRPERYQPQRKGAPHPNLSSGGVFEATGGYVFINAMPHQWPQLVRAMEMPELASDPRFKDERERLKNRVALREIIERWLKSFPSRDAALARMDQERVPCAPVLKLAESMKEPHLVERKTVRRVVDPTMGEFAVPGMPVKFSRWDDRTELKASRLGEDNEDVLREMLGLNAGEIAELYAEGILVRDPALDSGR